MSAMLPSRQLWAQGPHIVAIGGGTGLSTMLRGLKKYTKNLTAIVTVSDDGGGSGMLRRDIGMLPPGDIRHCMESLANTEPVMQQLLTYRFESGTLRGQCFGNLLLAALNGVTGSFDEAVRSMGQVLAISGTVIPVTTTDVRLTATFENGAYVVGESNIFGFKKQQDCRIDHVELLPAHPKALPDALDAIAAADLILLGPGSLYTSIIPNLLVDGVAEAIAASDAQKIYVCNIMTQDGETEGYTAADHLEALQRHGREGIVDLCLANNAPIPRGLAARYSEEDAELLRVDRERIAELDDYYASHPKQAADTFHAEFTANDGLAAPQSGVRNSFYAESDLLYSLANLFRDAGYRAPMIVDLFSLNADPAVLAMCEQVHEQLDASWDTFRYNYFAHWAKGKN